MKRSVEKDGLDSRCKCCRSIDAKVYREKNRDKFIERDRKRRDCPKVRAIEAQRSRAYYARNIEIARAKSKEIQARKRKTEEYRQYQNEYNRRRKAEDPSYKIACHLRKRVSECIRLQSGRKSGSCIKDLGCTLEQLKMHLESQFRDGMSWENYGMFGWHIDHIVPLSSYDLSDPEQFKKACHYTNLQPLWCWENYRKGATVPSEVAP